MTLRTLAIVRHHGMELTDYEFSVPLDHDTPSGEQIAIFARAVRNSENAAQTRPWLVFLQGGPGFPGPRPLKNSDWLKRALDDYHVLLLDSRGNGRSSVVLPRTLARRGSPRAQADYLMRFRADSIVRDAELIRRQLVGDEEPWSVLGQSYGGFCAVTYLSTYPHGLREVFITGACRHSPAVPTSITGTRIPRCSTRHTNSSIATRRIETSAPGSWSTCTGTTSPCLQADG